MLTCGIKQPPAGWAEYLSANADNSFTFVPKLPIAELPILPGHWTYSELSFMGIKIANVGPHEDEWQAQEAPPRKTRRALFWVIGPALKRITPAIDFGCSDGILEMTSGQWVIFDDRKTHWVMSDEEWVGVACQIETRKKKLARPCDKRGLLTDVTEKTR